MLSVRDLSFWYHLSEPPIIYNCNFEVEDGKFVAVVGESGGGKTTLLRLCCGLIQTELNENLACRYQVRGKVSFDENEVCGPLPDFSFVPQHFRESLHPSKTAKENILLAVAKDGISEEEDVLASRLMAQFGIAEVADLNVMRLSGGQQQRVSICRALVKNPRILFMDEPFANLDPTLRPAIGTLLRILQADQNLSLLFVTHDIEAALLLANTVLGCRSTYSTPEYETWFPADWDPIILREKIEDWIAK